MIMNIEEINNGIKQIGKISIDIKGYYDNHEKLVEGLNNVPVSELDKCLEYYSKKSGLIIDLRKELIETLKREGKITTDTLSELLNKHRKGKETQFRSYKNWFSIFYPPITFFGHNPIREFINSFIEQLVSDLKLKEEVKSTFIDFQGARQQGADRLWLAIYNKKQQSQSHGLQLFVEFFNGNVIYGVYRHSNQSYLKPPVEINYNDFDYNNVLSYFSRETDIIRNDIPQKQGFLQETTDENMNFSSSFSNQLIAFLEQAKSDNLKTKHFSTQYKETAVKVGFGQGVTARVPWISFLKEPNTTSNGIYPVYLFYKELNLLILAYGISETNVPNSSWNIQDPKTISEYFQDNNLGKPDRYGSSYIYKVYNVENLPAFEVLDDDLNRLIEIYLNNTMQIEAEKKESVLFDKLSFIDCLENAGLQFNPKLVTRFISSLLTKPFVILSGLSGSGKTKLAQAFAQWICHDDSQYCIVPVGADWTNREPLLGYPNALNQDDYCKPDNGALNVIIQSNKHSDLPYFLILDEMNLSHVERYFADFLSVMESKSQISLFNEGTVNNGVPAKLLLPSNLFIIGTVNVDETTYMFSPKVLDRANAIEFRVTKNEIETFFANQKEVNMDRLKAQGATMAQSFLEMAEKRDFEEQDLTVIHKILVSFFEQLKKTGAEFGYRSASEIIRLINQLTVIDADLQTDEKLDIAIMQKLLPKLHGSRRKLCPVLITLGRLCVNTSKIENIEKDVFTVADFDYETDGVLFPISLEKITRMYKGAIENGFASYAEA
jgi:5-methylcytosine-specific restriction enzyme B